MEVDLTQVSQEELDYWCKEYPDLDKEDIAMILAYFEMEDIKEEFWKANPTLTESEVNDVVAKNAAASYEYYLYRDFNNEAP